ncbi:MAG: trypsin-like peptidase domain-containing protein [Planctomycetota bacterium]
MFVKAIETASQFTRPIHSIFRYYKSQEVHPGAATMFFINNEGWALTCKHVAQWIMAGDNLIKQRQSYQADFDLMKGSKKEKHIIRELDQKYKLNKSTIFELRHLFVSCIEGNLSCDIKMHPNLDIALLHFKDYTKLLCTTFPVFLKDTSILQQGKFLCRLGFPFPEFTNFEYISAQDTIGWTQVGQQATPRFPIEGMLTRHLADANKQVIGFELSTPGLKGQSGGPAFDADGKVCGMQSATNHLDLDFDINKEVLRNGEKKHIQDSAFLHVGHCIHVDALKAFMQQERVAFQEG